MGKKLLSGVRPTRIELLKIKRRSVLAEKGRDLLEEKLDAMVAEQKKLTEIKIRQDAEFERTLKTAFFAVIRAEMMLGRRDLMSCAATVDSLPDIRAEKRSVMGTQVPDIFVPEFLEQSEPGYGLSGSDAEFDNAVRAFRQVLRSGLFLGETNGALLSTGREIKRTRRRVNALEKVLIPQLNDTAAYIEDYLEEIEREDMFRRKKGKALRAENEGI